jgi:uncharacterized protein (DUF488 family)
LDFYVTEYIIDSNPDIPISQGRFAFFLSVAYNGVMPIIYTIGHSNHPLSRLLEILQHQHIELVVDVRRYPSSRYNPQFNQPQLAAGLEQAGMSYRFMGDKLGGQERFEKIKARPEFNEGITELVKLASGMRLAILCAEEDPHRCHRHHLLEPEFAARGIRFQYIRGDGRIGVNQQLDLFSSPY